VGRGGQVLLKDVPGTLHVRIFAPLQFRVSDLMKRERVDEKHAAQMIRQSDQDSSGYIKCFFNADWDDPNLYHLLINTGKISVETGVKLIVQAVQGAEIQAVAEGAAEKVADLYLVQKIEGKLLELLGGEFQNVEARAKKGVVFLNGIVTSSVDSHNCERAIAALEGVEKVENRLSVVQHYRNGP
ncbi:MAG TPA: cytidylate kinase family protein, partial [Thermodesulfobacteriota bacterium]|nr:cytidylate kinase family protein [Thermodesulfobacteriota bacterium]